VSGETVGVAMLGYVFVGKAHSRDEVVEAILRSAESGKREEVPSR
jgi:hypothetical protein